MSEGYKKKDIQRSRQKNDVTSHMTSGEMSSADDNQRLELGIAAEKVTLVTTGDLAVSVQPKAGTGNSHTAINASTTISTTTLNHMASALEITYTSGSGRLIVLAR